MPKVSLIIPLYNASRHLKLCLDSVVSQTFKDFEVLLINDGSTDNTSQIVEKYIQKDTRFRLINQINSGVSAARNRGIKEAKADFIAFLDQDDMFHPQALEMLYQMINHYQTDVAAFQICFVADNFSKDTKQIDYNVDQEVKKAAFYSTPTKYFFRNYRGEPVYIWNRMYRKEALKKIEFPLTVQPAEDTVFTIKVMLTVKNIVITDIPLLYYRQNDDSVSKQGITEKYIRSHALAAEEMAHFLSSLSDLDETLQKQLASYLSRFIFKSLVSQPLRRIKGKNRINQLEKARALAVDFYKRGIFDAKLQGVRKFWACRLFFAHYDRLAKLFV